MRSCNWHQPRLMLGIVVLYCSTGTAWSLGNHPESSTCDKDHSWYAVCTSSRHNLEGWTGNCYSTADEARQEARQHANEFHQGNMRWTGITQAGELKKYQ